MKISLGKSLLAVVTEGARERSAYVGVGDARKISGRLVSDLGTPLSAVEALVISEIVGLMPGATILIPDALASGLREGMLARIDGDLAVKISGSDFGKTRSTVEGATAVAVLGDAAQILVAAAAKTQAGGVK